MFFWNLDMTQIDHSQGRLSMSGPRLGGRLVRPSLPILWSKMLCRWLGQYIVQLCLNICPDFRHRQWNWSAFPAFFVCTSECHQSYVFGICSDATCPARPQIQRPWRGLGRFGFNMIWQRYCNLVRLPFDNCFPRC